jgi:cell division protein FtsQ
MTTLKKTTRANSIRQRRSSQAGIKPAANTQRTPGSPKTGAGDREQAGARRTTQTARQAYHPQSFFLPVEPRPVAPTTLHKMKDSADRQFLRLVSRTGTKGSASSRMTRNPRRKAHDFAFSIGRTAVRAPALSLPNLGPRWISAGLTLLLGLLLYTMGTANTFKVTAAEVSGNQRLDTAEVNAMLGMVGQPIFKAIPSQIEKNLRAAFPDLAGVHVTVAFPNRINVALVERTPILIWSQDGKTTWIDTNGVAFMPRGDVQGLIQIASSGTPPQLPVDPQKPISDQLFIEPAMVKAILALYPQVPSGSPMIYDPKYGIGWQDPRGWSVYFGRNTQDTEMKKKIYQAILDTFSLQGIQPTLVSVAYLDAPFYK